MDGPAHPVRLDATLQAQLSRWLWLVTWVLVIPHYVILTFPWRVAYYSYDGPGSDRYPPFSLADRGDDSARLELVYPERLSRGLALVKWWLLAIPHHLVLSIFLGGIGYAVFPGAGWRCGTRAIPLLALIAGVARLATCWCSAIPMRRAQVDGDRVVAYRVPLRGGTPP